MVRKKKKDMPEKYLQFGPIIKTTAASVLINCTRYTDFSASSANFPT